MRQKALQKKLLALFMATALPISGNTFAQLEEVIVTANKRAQSINDVGLSISAVSGNKLKEQKLTSLEEISSAIPGLVYSTSTANTPIFTLRGIGFNEQSLGAYPATSLYLDEAPLPFPALASHTAYDLERVEVLKGPQGILFGQNSTGGAINFIAAKPTDELSYGGDISYSRFNKIELNGFTSGPLTDTISARLAITGVNADEWQKSTSRNDENGAEKYFAARLILSFEPTDGAHYMLNLNAWNDQSDPQAQQFAARNPQIPVDAATGLPPATLAPLLAQPFSPENPRAADWTPFIINSNGSVTPFEPSSKRDFFQFIARGDWDLNDTTTLTALTTYSEFEQNQTTDGDGSPLVLFDLERSEADIDTWITELRLTGSTDSNQWIIGANYEKSNTFEDQELRYIDNTNYTAQNLFINGSSIRNVQEIDSYAIFANIDHNINDVLTAKIGARYTDSKIDVESCNYSTGDGAVAALFNLLPILFGNTTPFTPIGGFPDCYSLNFDGIPGELYTDSLTEDNISWRLGLDYNVNDSILVYANISKGYKSGSFPSLAASSWLQYQPVTQESVLAYELGFKASLVDNRVQLNGALFQYEYKNKQLRTKRLDPVFGFLDILDNVPETEISGVEADIIMQVTSALTLTAAVTYLDSEVVTYQGVSVTSQIVPSPTGLQLAGGLEDFSGDAIPFTPELTYSFDADYRINLNTGITAFVGLNVTGQSNSDSAFGGSRLSYDAGQLAVGAASATPNFNKMEGYGVWGARLGLEAEDGNWRIMLWGKNIANEYYITNTIVSSDSISRFAGRPATYGLTVGFSY